jgi:hypothetical protein
MAGYNYFPATYQPNYYGGMYNPQPQVPQIPTPAQAPQQQANSGLIWVQGESGAKSYLVAPNTTVLLMDSESNKFYLKSSDVSGMPQPLRVFEYTEKTGQQTQKAAPDVDLGEYVTKREFDEFKTTLKSSFGVPKEKVSKEAKDE